MELLIYEIFFIMSRKVEKLSKKIIIGNYYYRSPKDSRLYDMKVKEGCAFLRSYYKSLVQQDAWSTQHSFALRVHVVKRVK